jgi:hypothetical protein
MAVVVLPALGDARDAALLESALMAELPDVAGFRNLPLSDASERALQADPACREQPDCLLPLLPSGADLVLDARLVEVQGMTSVDLRLLRHGELSKRTAVHVGPESLAVVVERELPMLLAGWARDERLYRLALEGNTEAADALRERFPTSPYTRALDR